MRYSIERVRGSSGDTPALALRAHPDDWTLGEGQVEISVDEVARHADPRTLAERWHVVEFEPHRLGANYARLEALLVSMGPPSWRRAGIWRQVLEILSCGLIANAP